MSKTWNRTETWLALAVVGIGGLLAAIAGLHAFMTIVATPLHPDVDGVPSVADVAPPPAWTTAVERARGAMRAGVAKQNLPGLSVAVGVDGHLVWAEGFGWADLEKRVPVSPRHRFRIGTASMPLTSAAVGVLLEQGQLKLDEPIQTYVPEYPKQQWPVTLRQLMGHTAGVRADGGDEGPLLGTHCDRPVEGLQGFADASLLFQPGTGYHHSSYGWILVSAAVEAATHQAFFDVMRQQVFEPLGMADTRADVAAEATGRATPYFPRYAAEPHYGPDLMRDVDYSCYAGGGAIVSTPSDLVRFGMAVNGGTLLKPATLELLQTSQRLPSGEATGYGLGWDLETVSLAGTPTRVVGHDGESLGGKLTSLMIVRERGLVVAVTSNISYADTPGLALQIAEVFASQPGAATRK